LVGGFDRRLYAVDASSGEKKWSFKADNWFWTRPLVEGEAVYAGSLDGNVYALGLADGKRLWSYNLQAPVRAAPVMVGSTLLVAGRNGRVVGLNPGNGELVWALPIELGKTLLADPLPQGDVVYYSAQGGSLFKVMPADGTFVPLLLVQPGTPAAGATPVAGTQTPGPATSPTPGGTPGAGPTQAGTP